MSGTPSPSKSPSAAASAELSRVCRTTPKFPLVALIFALLRFDAARAQEVDPHRARVAVEPEPAAVVVADRARGEVAVAIAVDVADGDHRAARSGRRDRGRPGRRR
jgi:hypothetical protein